MAYINDSDSDQTASSADAELVKNILRILCMPEKELNRIARRNYHNRRQYRKYSFRQNPT